MLKSVWKIRWLYLWIFSSMWKNAHTLFYIWPLDDANCVMCVCIYIKYLMMINGAKEMSMWLDGKFLVVRFCGGMLDCITTKPCAYLEALWHCHSRYSLTQTILHINHGFTMENRDVFMCVHTYVRVCNVCICFREMYIW